MELLEIIAASVLTGVISSLATVAALKTDIAWIKRELEQFENRINKLEDK